MTTGVVTGRSIPRYRGEPVTHDVRFYGISIERGERVVITARCDCGWSVIIDGGHSGEQLLRLTRQHAGTEDPP